jgi:hypothetical protein
MQYIPYIYICILLLAIANVFNTIRIRNLEANISVGRKDADTQRLATNTLFRKINESEEARERLARRIAGVENEVSELEKWKDEASELIEAHAELEKEAANSERMFQEGLSNLLNYGVGKE